MLFKVLFACGSAVSFIAMGVAMAQNNSSTIVFALISGIALAALSAKE